MRKTSRSSHGSYFYLSATERSLLSDVLQMHVRTWSHWTSSHRPKRIGRNQLLGRNSTPFAARSVARSGHGGNPAVNQAEEWSQVRRHHRGACLLSYCTQIIWAARRCTSCRVFLCARYQETPCRAVTTPTPDTGSQPTRSPSIFARPVPTRVLRAPSAHSASHVRLSSSATAPCAEPTSRPGLFREKSHISLKCRREGPVAALLRSSLKETILCCH